MFKPKKILVPTDFSECGGQCAMLAVKQAVEIAIQNNSELFFLHVISDALPKKPLFFLDDEKIELLERKVRENAQEDMDELIEKVLKDTKDIKYNVIIREGVPYDEILKEEENSDIDLVCIGTRGLSALKGFLAGSTTEKVVRYSKCNVLIAKKSLEE